MVSLPTLLVEDVLADDDDLAEPLFSSVAQDDPLLQEYVPGRLTNTDEGEFVLRRPCVLEVLLEEFVGVVSIDVIQKRNFRLPVSAASSVRGVVPPRRPAPRRTNRSAHEGGPFGPESAREFGRDSRVYTTPAMACGRPHSGDVRGLLAPFAPHEDGHRPMRKVSCFGPPGAATSPGPRSPCREDRLHGPGHAAPSESPAPKGSCPERPCSRRREGC